MFIVIIITLIILFCMRKKYPDYFFVTDGASKNMYLKMHADGMHHEKLAQFERLENEFLKLVYTSQTTGIPYIIQTSLLSNKIKETFPSYDFSYHTIYLKKSSTVSQPWPLPRGSPYPNHS